MRENGLGLRACFAGLGLGLRACGAGLGITALIRSPSPSPSPGAKPRSPSPVYPRARLLLIATLALATTGCAGLLASYDVAPNGLTRRDDALRQLLAAGRPDSALHRVSPESGAAPEDELLRSLYAGILSHYAGRYDESGSALQHAADLAEDRYTKRISRAALSLLSSDRILPYEPGPTERLFIHYYGALNFLKQGDLRGATVEARRLGFLLEGERGGEGGLEDRTRAMLAFLRYFTGTVFEAAGERNDADVAYRNAFALLGAEGPLPTASPLPDTLGEVVVVVEEGFVAHRVEQSLIVPIHPIEAARITGGEADDRLGAAAGVAARVVARALHEGNRGVLLHGHKPRTLFVDLPPASVFERECAEEAADTTKRGSDRKTCEEDDDNPYILRIAWPVYRLDQKPVPGLALVGPDGREEPLRVRADLTDAVVRDFEEERAVILVRTLARATAKLSLTRSVERTLGENEAAVGQLLGLLTNLGTALLEQADTRSWQLLPGRIGLTRLRLPPGTHPLALALGGAGPDRRIELGTAEVHPGRTTYVSARVWR